MSKSPETTPKKSRSQKSFERFLGKMKTAQTVGLATVPETTEKSVGEIALSIASARLEALDSCRRSQQPQPGAVLQHTMAFKVGKAAATRRIVKWLRQEYMPSFNGQLRLTVEAAADAIERGEHEK